MASALETAKAALQEQLRTDPKNLVRVAELVAACEAAKADEETATQPATPVPHHQPVVSVAAPADPGPAPTPDVFDAPADADPADADLVASDDPEPVRTTIPVPTRPTRPAAPPPRPRHDDNRAELAAGQRTLEAIRAVIVGLDAATRARLTITGPMVMLVSPRPDSPGSVRVSHLSVDGRRCYLRAAPTSATAVDCEVFYLDPGTLAKTVTHTTTCPVTKLAAWIKTLP